MPLDRNQTLDRVRKVLAEQMGLTKAEAATITLATNPADDLGADSLDQVEIVMAFEEEFETELEDELAESIRTVGDAVEILIHSGNMSMQASIAHKLRKGIPLTAPVVEKPEFTLTPLSAIVNTDFMADGVKVFVEKFNANMESARKLHAARVTDLEGSDAFEIAMGGRLSLLDVNAICELLEGSGFIFQHVVEHIECFETENGDSYEIVSYVSYTLPKWKL